MCHSQRADAKLKTKEWNGFFHEKLYPALLRLNMEAQHVYNQDDSG